MFETATVIAVIVGVVEVVKKAFALDSKYAPLLALVLGVAGFGFLNGFSAESVFTGIIAGLSASGLYAGAKTTLRK